ncbi:MAG: glycosyltransferase [Victivallaceae bacterium]|nr:glycosyltransferase [Victivallaceae bacterium]
MRWNFFTRYDGAGASSRLRHFLWREKIASLGVDAGYFPFFTDGELSASLKGTKNPFFAAGSYRRRFAALASPRDGAVVEYEALPFFPARLEALWLKRTPYVLDFDDDVALKYARFPGLRGKFSELARRAAGVIVANRFLQEKFSSCNERILLLPTPIERIASPTPKFPVFTVVWIGSRTTRRRYLEKFAPVLRALAARIDYRLLAICDEAPELPGVPLVFEKWDPATQETLLAKSHVGIMPLDDGAFARGKSAYKLIQYLGAGIPAVASPVGENRFVLAENETGCFARDPGEWCDAIVSFSADPRRAEKFGAAARLAAKRYLRDALWENYRDFLQECFSKTK